MPAYETKPRLIILTITLQCFWLIGCVNPNTSMVSTGTPDEATTPTSTAAIAKTPATSTLLPTKTQASSEPRVDPMVLVKTLPWTQDKPQTLAVSPDGLQLLLADGSRAGLYEIETGVMLWEIEFPQTAGDERRSAFAPTFSPTLSAVALGFDDGSVYVLSAAKGELLASYVTVGPVLNLAFDDTGRGLFSASRPYDGFPTIIYYDIENQRQDVFAQNAGRMVFIRGANLLVTSFLEVFDVESRALVDQLSTEFVATNIRVSPHAKWLVGSVSDNALVWRVDDSRFVPVSMPIECIGEFAGEIGSASISDEGVMAALIMVDELAHEVRLCDMTSEKYLGFLPSVAQYVFMSENRALVRVTTNAPLTIWEFTSN